MHGTAAAMPNVVLIFMDDMTHWALTSSQCRTPSLDRLRARGSTFTHAFNQGSMDAAVCMPARQMLISGLTLFDARDRFMDVPHLGTVMRENGYQTFFTGKWHNEIEALENDYDEVGPWGPNMLHSTAEGGAAYHRPAAGNTWDPSDRTLGGHWMKRKGGGVEHSSQRWTDAAVDFLTRTGSDRPFFLHIAYHAPHDPRQSDAEFLAMYPQDDVRIPPNAMPEHPFDNGELDVRDEDLAPHPRTHEAVRLHRREYFAILTHADREIGRILDALEQIGADENTLVVFSGDHGLALGEHGLMGKQNLYDHSVRVPLVLAGPDIARGSTTDALVYSGSIFATICDYAGISIPVHIGFPTLRDALSAAPPTEPIYGAYKDVQRSIRTPTHKLIEYPKIEYTQLFSVQEDPWELRNLANDEEQRQIVNELRVLLRDKQCALGDPLAQSSAGTHTE